MRRHHIVLGDLTTVGGIVTSATSTYSIEGKRVPLEGDYVSCRACKSVGHIICDGPRIEERENGKLLVLEGDLCACGCVPHPRLIPSQALSFHTIEGRGMHEASALQSPESVESPQDEEILEQFFEILDEHGRPVYGYKFDLHADDEVHEKAGHFAFGRTSAINKDADAQIVMWPRGDGGADHG